MILQVRCQTHTARHVKKRYYDSDCNKWILDKAEKIESYSLGDITDDCVHNNISYGSNSFAARYYDRDVDENLIISLDLIEKEKEQRDRAAKIAKQAQEKRLALETEVEKERIYSVLLAEAEKRNDQMIYLGGVDHGKPVSNIRPNNWVPKQRR